MTVKEFTYRDLVELAGPEKAAVGMVNQMSGPAFTLRDGQQILAVGGVRITGIGEAWAMLSEAGLRKPKTVLKTARSVLEGAMIAERLICVYADPSVDKPAWFEHLGFTYKQGIYAR
jgi:hypothetical protein